ncbi:MAG: hypothetical protein WCE30_17045 [Mycobacterium sp.]
MTVVVVVDGDVEMGNDGPTGTPGMRSVEVELEEGDVCVETVPDVPVVLPDPSLPLEQALEPMTETAAAAATAMDFNIHAECPNIGPLNSPSPQADAKSP